MEGLRVVCCVEYPAVVIMRSLVRRLVMFCRKEGSSVLVSRLPAERGRLDVRCEVDTAVVVVTCLVVECERERERLDARGCGASPLVAAISPKARRLDTFCRGANFSEWELELESGCRSRGGSSTTRQGQQQGQHMIYV